jgi:hypothetical protein
MEISKVITHEQWVLTNFLSRDSLALILVKFSQFLVLGIIKYGLIINMTPLVSL